MNTYKFCVCFLLMFVLLFLFSSIGSAEESSLYGYTEEDNFFSKGETYRPTVSFYSTNQHFLDFRVYKLNSFSLKDGQISFSGKNPVSSGKLIYHHRIDNLRRGNVSAPGIRMNISKSGKNTYTSGTFKLPTGKNGIYYLVIQGKNKKFEKTFIVSPLSMIVKHSPDFVEGIVFNQKNDKPVPDIKVKLFDASGPRYEYTTDANGCFRFDAGQSMKGIVTVIAKRGEEYSAFSFSSSDASNKVNVYFYTDRPVYRPGHKVCFKGIVTELGNDKTFRRAAEKEVKVLLRDPRNSNAASAQLITNQMGSFNGEFDIPETTPLGRHYLAASIDGREYNCFFDVQEYRKPEFEVFVQPEKSVALKGSEVKINVRARYYYGNPVKGGKITYTVEGRQDSLDVPGEYDWYSWYSERNTFYTTGTAVLDQTGAGSFIIRIPPDLKFDQNLGINCSVTDKSNLAIEGFSSLRARISNRRVALVVKPYCIKKGESIKIHAYTTDAENNPAPSSVKVVLSFDKWNSKTGKYTEEVFKTINMSTDSSGHGYYDQVCPKTGYITANASVQDDDRNPNYARSNFYVYSGDDSWYSDYDYSELKIITDKKSYNPGDNARVLILTGKKDMSLYVTLEQDKMYKRWIIPVRSSITSFDIPILPEYAPGVYVKVCYVSRGTYRSGQAFLEVPVKDKYIDLKISSNKEVYKPGETAIYEITTKNTEGAPVPAEVSLGVVDDAIYAISPETVVNIRAFFYGKRPNLISTNYSVPKEYPGGSYQKVPEKKSKSPDVEIRKKFKDTTYWNPLILTDEKGYAKVAVELAENLTRWRATARGFTQDIKVGQNTHKVTARKDLTIRLAAPRFFRYKDKITVSSIVSNDSKTARQVTISFSVNGAELINNRVESRKTTSSGNSCEETVEIKAGGEQVFSYDLSIDKWNPNAAVTLKATAYASDDLSDGVLQTYPLIPFGEENKTIATALINDKYTSDIRIPDDVINGTAKLKIALAPSIASNVMGSLDYLAQYPYGCVEQTMSRFLPNCIMKETMKELGISSPELEKKLPKMVSLGFSKLYGYQHNDGGWGWWKDDDTHPFLTAYVIYGFYRAEKAGYKVDKNVLDRGLQSLQKQFDSEKDANTKAFMLYSLTLYGKAGVSQVSSVYDMRGNLNNYGLALLALACSKNSDKTKLDEVISLLGKKAVKEGNYIYWNGTDDYGWMSNDIETTCWVLAAYLENKPNSDEIRKIINWIISRKTGDHWNCTKTTGYVVMALSGYLSGSGEMNANFDAVVKINGKQAATYHFNKASVFEPEKVITIGGNLPGESPVLRKGNNTIEIEKKGEGRLYYSGELTSYSDREPSRPDNRHFEIIKTYWVKDGEKFKVLDKPAKTGEEVLVELKIKPDKDYQFVMIEDPLPSGFEVKEINKLQGYYYTNAEKRDNRMVCFQTWMWSRSQIVFSYAMRAERPGQFNVMPAKAELMYRPEIRGMGLPMKINAVEEESK